MNALSLEREKEFQAVKKKLAAMEKLNRALQEERTKLIQSAKNGGGEETTTTLVMTLAMDGIAHLCRAGLIDIRTTLKVSQILCKLSLN